MAQPEAGIRNARGESVAYTPGGPHAVLIRSADYLPFQPPSGVRILHTQAEFPGSAVRVDGTVYEVVAERVLPDGSVEYDLDPWQEKFILRRVFTYDNVLLERVQLARRRAAFRERWHWAGIMLAPLIGMLPEESQEQLCARFGISARLATRLSCLLELAGWPLIAQTLRPHMEGGAALLLIPFMVVTLTPAIIRSVGAFLFGEITGSAWGELVSVLAQAAERGARVAGDSRLLTRSMFWKALERGDTVSHLPDGGYLVESAIPHPAWLDGTGARTGTGHWGVTALAPWGFPEPPVFPYLLVARRGENLLAKDPGAPPPRAYGMEMAHRIRLHWESWFAMFPGVVPCLAPAAQARALAALGAREFPAAWVRRSLGTPLVLALGLAAGAHWMSDLPALLSTWLVLMLLAEALLRAALLVAGRPAPSLLGVLVTDLLPPERTPFLEHRKAWQDTVEAMDERGAGR